VGDTQKHDRVSLQTTLRVRGEARQSTMFVVHAQIAEMRISQCCALYVHAALTGRGCVQLMARKFMCKHRLQGINPSRSDV
jgi:hypothetical protein